MVYLIPTLQILIGLVALYYGGNFLVTGAAGIAKRFHISTIIIGLTVVAFGTSAPELFVSSLSAIRGSSGVAIGNIIGSNIINIALILGLICLFMPVTISRGIIRRDIPIMLLSYFFMILVMVKLSPDFSVLLPGVISRIQGIFLIFLLLGYIVILYCISKKDPQKALEVIDVHEIEDVSDHESWFKLLSYLTIGILGLAFGADTLVTGASWLALNVFHVSERFVGITIVAFGTSLPELVTSIVAMAKKQTDISVGNVIGSNIFNSLMVLGTAATIKPIPIDLNHYLLDLGYMIGISLFLFFVAFVFKTLRRWTGLAFLGLYATYFMVLFQTRI